MPRKPANKRKVTENVQPSSRAHPKRRAAGKKKDPVVISPMGNPTPPPASIHSINSHNRLHMLPLDMKRQYLRPWYFYDIVEPAPRFRPIPHKYRGNEVPAVVSESEYSDDLSDHPGQGKLPVSWSSYLQKYAIYVPWKKEVLDATLFEYDQEDVIEIEVGAILRPVRYPEEVKRVGMTTHYKIPAGYRPALLGFNREIKVILEENTDDAKRHFRYHYLIRILDAFVEELRKRTVQNPGVFRSRVLNPLIQRQSRGVHDNDSDEVKEAVGANYEDAVDFYLAGDPLDPKQSREWLQHLLNTTPVRLNLGRFRFQYNTDVRQKHSAVPQHTGDQLVLPAFKIEVIRCKYLEELYRKLIGGLGKSEISATRREGGNPPVNDGEDNGALPLAPATRLENNNPLVEVVREDSLLTDESHGKPVAESTPAGGLRADDDEVEASMVEAMLL